MSEASGLVAKPEWVWRLADLGLRDSEVEGALVPEGSDVVRRTPKGSGGGGCASSREGAGGEAAATGGARVEVPKLVGEYNASTWRAPKQRTHRGAFPQSAVWPNRTATYTEAPVTRCGGAHPTQTELHLPARREKRGEV